MLKPLVCLLIITVLTGAALFFGQTSEVSGLLPPEYEKAETWFNGSTEANNTDSLALLHYQQALRKLPEGRWYAPYIFRCRHRIASLHQTYNQFPEAMAYYHQAIQTHRRWSLSDSLVFDTYLFAGNIHYVTNHFDSALYYFELAEKILTQFPGQPEKDRLYNSLGAIYFESGNYSQSINYFSQALQLLSRSNPDYRYAVYSFNSNIASALRHLGRPDSAMVIYKSLLPLQVNRGQLLLNMANVSLQMQQPGQALGFLRMLPADGSVNPASAEVRMGQCQAMLNVTGAARQHFQNAIAAFGKQTTGKSTEAGLACLEYGRLLERLQQHDSALVYYHRAIIQYDYHFNDTAVLANPLQFENQVKGYELFEALSAKASCLARLGASPGQAHLYRHAVAAYDATFALAAFIRKTFDNDEARIFISDKLFAVYEKAIQFLLNRYRSSGDAALLQKALLWMSLSKTASLAVHLKENDIKSFSGIPDSLLQKEKNLKLGLSGLLVAMQNATPGEEQEKLAAEVTSQRLRLSRLVSDLHAYPDYYRMKFAADSFNLAGFQQTMLHNRNAVLHYFKTDNRFHLVVIRHNRLHHHVFDADSAFRLRLNRLITELENPLPGKKYAGSDDAVYLYRQLMEPAEGDLDGVQSLMVIPDGDLIRLPFDVLEQQYGQYLAKRYNISYQFALPFLKHLPEKFFTGNTLAIAPFAKEDAVTGYMALPSSLNEVSVKGVTLLKNAEAVRGSFVRQMASASMIHLATHAYVDRSDPQQSHIVFYPSGDSGTAHKLYAHELYNYDLRKLQLVFLSACETGAGQLQRAEGALSLARAFSYAGCPNIIMSLWKAEDHATAYISRRFYQYLEQDLPPDRALNLAKQDLLNDADMSQFHSPGYWSHLVFIGSMTHAPAAKNFIGQWWWIAAAVVVMVLYYWLRRRRFP